MTQVAAAVLPHPPLLVPELAGAAAAELDPLRAACGQALSAVLAASDSIVVVGDGPVWGIPAPSAQGSFRAYGADVQVNLPALIDLALPSLPPPARLHDLPLSLAVAAHLLAGLASRPARLFAATVPPALGPRAAAAIGRALVAAAGQAAAGDPLRTVGGSAAGRRVGLVVMGDLSACRTEQAPGAFRPGAAEFDASVAEALRTANPERLLDLDPTQAADLLVAGRVPLQVLAGAFEAGPGAHQRLMGEGGLAVPGRVADEAGSAVRGRVLYDDAPYGIGYLVALLSVP
jgi:hypothetical protein